MSSHPVSVRGGSTGGTLYQPIKFRSYAQSCLCDADHSNDDDEDGDDDDDDEDDSALDMECVI